jgi:hypothetical protein
MGPGVAGAAARRTRDRIPAQRAEVGGMTVGLCAHFHVPCDRTDTSCEECVIRTWAREREAKRERVEARRRVLLGRAAGTEVGTKE